jgi:hypothetical protein
MDGWLKVGTQTTIKYGPFVDGTDGNSDEPAVALTDSNVLIAKNGGAFAAKAETTHPVVDAASPGGCYYDVILGTGDTDTLGILKVGSHIAGSLHVFQTYLVISVAMWDAFFGTGNVPANVLAIDDDTTAADNLELMFDGTGYAGGTTKLDVGVAASVAAAVTCDDATAAKDDLANATDGLSALLAAVNAARDRIIEGSPS